MNTFRKTTLALTAVMALTCLACTPKPSPDGQQAPPPDVTQQQQPPAENNANAQEQTNEAKAQEGAPATEAGAPSGDIAPAQANSHGLVPFPDVKAPEITKAERVTMTTDAGKFVIDVYPEAAPNAAERFMELVNKGFYDGTPIFRVVTNPRPFVAQFGINWNPLTLSYKESNFNDDPSYFQLLPGTLAFAKAGPNTNSTQVFINLADNSPLRSDGFTTFARIVEGMDNLKNLKSVGDPQMGLDQESLWMNGEAYLKSLPEKPTMIKEVVVAGK